MSSPQPDAAPLEAPPPHEMPGHALPVWRTKVNGTRQRRYHAAAAVDGALYGDRVDVSVLANDCLMGARPKDALGAKRLHMGVRVRQSAAVPLGAALTVRGVVGQLMPAKRGRIITIDFAFQTDDGATPIRIDHRSLILDPTPLPPGGKAPAPPRDEGFKLLRRLPLTPAMVSGYSYEFPHLDAHHDRAAARAIGMRAGIAQGLMGFTLLLAERMRLGTADSFDIDARFTRPIFWDDALTLEARGDRDFRARNGEGKTVSELKVAAWGDRAV